MSGLFSYFSLGIQSLQAAQLGIQVAGDNIANANTPGFARRRVDYATGVPIRVQGGTISHGVQVDAIRRLEDRLAQSSLEREQGNLGFTEHRLEGLRQIEGLFGTLDGKGLPAAYSEFSAAFSQLAGQPDSLALRQSAIGAARRLAESFNSTFQRLSDLQQQQSVGVDAAILETNDLGGELVRLNQQILESEADGTTAAPLRDQRQQVLERLSALTGGNVVTGSNQLGFVLQDGTTLVTGSTVLPLQTTRDPAGLSRIIVAGRDITDTVRGGELGARLHLRDDEIPARLNDLNLLAQDLNDRANTLTAAASDLNGSAGLPLFNLLAPATQPALAIEVNPALVADAALLAISGNGAPGDGSAALALADLPESTSAALGSRTPREYLTDALGALGSSIARADIDYQVGQGLVEDLQTKRESVSGVSLDEEAVDLLRFQRAYEASARFIRTINEITELTVNLI